MERFRKYVDRELQLENVKNEAVLEQYGVVCTYLPDPLEDFDELEFRTDFQGKNDIVFIVSVELGKVKRILFSAADQENPELISSLSQSQLKEFLDKHGERMTEFFDSVTH